MQLSGYSKAMAVVLHDTNLIAPPFTTKALYVGGAGNLKVTINGVALTFTGVPAGTILPIKPSIAWATGSTATLVVALGD